jgi:hypothetical protein
MERLHINFEKNFKPEKYLFFVKYTGKLSEIKMNRLRSTDS